MTTGTRAARYDERRTQLALTALETLGELGYARTSLRDIAARSEFSHGVVHYYFAGKTELITHGVRLYKAQCVTRYDEVVATSATAEQLRVGFADALVTTMTTDAPMHRLWYDLRTQSMVEPELRPDVGDIDHQLEQMIWRVVSRYAELASRPPAFDAPTAYALLDGVFEHALRDHLAGDATAAEALRSRALAVVPALVGGLSRPSG